MNREAAFLFFLMGLLLGVMFTAARKADQPQYENIVRIMQ